MHHIIHDLDRDGWGSAALLVVELGAEGCRLYPTRHKDLRPIFADLTLDARDHLWVLDIPAPPTWTGLEVPDGVRATWVDHHLPAWTTQPPGWVDAILPNDRRPTTTMSLLVKRGLVNLAGAMDFVHRLCADDGFDWGLVFDGLSAMFPDLPVPVGEIPPLLAVALCGESVPTELEPARSHALKVGHDRR